jgi:hypothetical protein
MKHSSSRYALRLALGLLCLLCTAACGRTILWPGDEPPPGQENCANGIDDDGDGLVDCKDPDCANHPSCRTTPVEDCENGLDDDGDGFVDCQDLDCANHPSCATTPEICDNGFDDDGDGLTDCNDPECFNHPDCTSTPEICDNGVDDDGDGLVDCNDPQCFGHPACQSKPEDCTNGIDDDGDNLTDCNDPECFSHPACQSKPEICDNGIDDDGDGFTDCNDPQCFGHPSCKTNPEICDNGIDDDGDGLVDCKDPQCLTHPSCKGGPEICNNGQDDDNDGAIDCDDPDCKNDPVCLVKQENCSNKKDDDGDSLVDCDDPDCFKHPDCKTPGKEVCNNGIDDDEDMLVDCDDPDCKGLPICTPGKEVCDNKKDDDGDGAVDCDDPDCKSFPACVGQVCKPQVDFGTIKPKGSKSTRTLDTQGKKDIYTSSCVIPGGGEVVARFELTGKTDLKLEYEQKGGDHVFALFRAGLAEPCNANPRGCFDPQSAKNGVFSIKALDAGVYYLMAEAFAATLEGVVVVTLSTGPATQNEICNNGKDDDGDLAIDCADLDCALHPSCQNQLCKWDVNLGTLVVNGPAKTATVDTSTAPSTYDLTCAAGGGGDRVVRFAMPSAAILGVTTNQAGWHAFGLERSMGPGTKCDADPKGSCSQKQWPAFVSEYGTQEKGVYFFIVDAMKPGSGGKVTLSFKAYKNRGPELCKNGIDDDGDGLVDCKDPDCTGVLGCPGPVCKPDYKTGPLVPGGKSASVSINLKSHNNDQTLSCALGGGKDAVIEIDLPQVAALEINCNQSGDHILGLFDQGQPRDPCDKSELSCADPKVGPIGCHFFWTNMQPGKYYLIVEAFKPGSEGSFSVTMKAAKDFVQEICNNGKDDDGDGKVDCQDYNCANKPICQGQTCTPDKKLGILPSAGTPVFASATTTGAGDQQNPGCASGGGEDYVFGFTLVNAGSLQIDYAQFGNHVFALYNNKGQGQACDAAPVAGACQTTNSKPSGKVQFSGLLAGEYYLVVEAASAGSEGSVVLQLLAK